MEKRSKYLSQVLKSYSKSQDQEIVRFYKYAKQKIGTLQTEAFGNLLISKPIYSGSIRKSTELITRFDTDLIIPFKNDSFRSPDEIHDFVLQFSKQIIKKEFKEIVKVRRQRVSTGLTISNVWLRSIKIDLVPGIEPRKGSYSKTRSLYLWDTKEKKKILTNIHKQHQYLSRSHPNANKIVRLFKVLKYYHPQFPSMKSFLLEVLIAKGFHQVKRSRNFPIDLNSQMMIILDYIIDQIEDIKFQDPGNPRNCVSDLLSMHKRKKIRSFLRKMRSDLNSDANSYQVYFPISSLSK